MPKTYFGHYEMTSQFEGAERIATKWGISRADTDAFGLRSQQNAKRAWETDPYVARIVEAYARMLGNAGRLRRTGDRRPAAR